MAEVQLSPEARRDLLAVLEYLDGVAGPRAARQYDTLFKQTIDRLAQFPGIGSLRPNLGAETRLVMVDPYLVFYDGGPSSTIVHVVRILHGRMNITPDLIARGRGG